MCDITTASRRARTPQRPRWGLLYGLVTLMLAALAAVEFVTSPGAARTVLQCGLTLGGFGAMGLWARLNRRAIDQQDWCECAGEKVTVRVISSRRPEPSPVEQVVFEDLEDEALIDTAERKCGARLGAWVRHRPIPTRF